MQIDLRTRNSWVMRLHEVGGAGGGGAGARIGVTRLTRGARLGGCVIYVSHVIAVVWQVSTAEAAEVLVINTLAPFIINSRLKALMERHPGDEKFIVNVRCVLYVCPPRVWALWRRHTAARLARDPRGRSAMEGKFYRYKTPAHPHTNMAKAALNMMTRTSAEDYARSNIFMNSVPRGRLLLVAAGAFRARARGRGVQVDTGWINDENPAATAARTATDANFQTPIDEVRARTRGRTVHVICLCLCAWACGDGRISMCVCVCVFVFVFVFVFDCMHVCVRV